MWNPAHIDGPILIEGDTGYHLNASPQAAAGAEAYRVEPATPDRVFAGAETVFLRFADEAEARAVLAAWWTA